jgi:hypothetical protein
MEKMGFLKTLSGPIILVLCNFVEILLRCFYDDLRRKLETTPNLFLVKSLFLKTQLTIFFIVVA